MKTSYHPAVLVAFYLQCLPQELLQHIPRSTQYDWLHKNLSACFGYEWYCQNQHFFYTLKEVAGNKRLLQVNRAMLRIIAIQNFLKSYAAQIHERAFNAAATVVSNIKKVQDVLGITVTLKLMNFSYQQYWQLRQKLRCKKSLFNLCLSKHPAQLMRNEVSIIKKYCEDRRFIHWPLASIYHRIIRDGVAHFHLSTFYKYTGLLQLKRSLPAHRRKNHFTGIRAAVPFQLLHADVTVFKTADNIKAYIHLIQDDFSRTILQFFVSPQCKAETLFELLKKVHREILQPSNIQFCQLMTDDGSENFGVVQDFLNQSENPEVQHIVAQKDIDFSNSMIEAANKNLKYRFLYHKHISDYSELCKYIQEAVDDYNNRPHDVLNGLTPLEALNGKTFDHQAFKNKIAIAKAARIAEIRKAKCCFYSF